MFWSTLNTHFRVRISSVCILALLVFVVYLTALCAVCLFSPLRSLPPGRSVLPVRSLFTLAAQSNQKRYDTHTVTCTVHLQAIIVLLKDAVLLNTRGQMHKTLCRFTTKTLCTHKQIILQTHSFRQIYEAAHTPDFVLEISIIVELGSHAQASFPLLQFAINGLICLRITHLHIESSACFTTH